MRIACLLKWFYGVTVAQEILVLLETVRFSLELPPLKYYCYFNLCASACESSSALFIVYFFRCFLFMILKYYISTACDKSLSFAIKAIR